jgi:rod shape determining protein RodA
VCILTLGIAGVFFIYSAQKFTGNTFWLKQLMWLGIGAAVYAVTSLIDYKYWLQYGHIPYLLPSCFWWRCGRPGHGARRGAALAEPARISYQPSEAAKLAVLIMVSSVLARGELGTLRQSSLALLKVFVITIIPIVLIFAQPDLGSTVVFGPMIFSLLYVSRLSQRFFTVVLCGFLAVLAIVGLDMYRYYEFLSTERAKGREVHDILGEYKEQGRGWLPLHDYQRNRLLTFVAPDAVDPAALASAGTTTSHYRR